MESTFAKNGERLYHHEIVLMCKDAYNKRKPLCIELKQYGWEFLFDSGGGSPSERSGYYAKNIVNHDKKLIIAVSAGTQFDLHEDLPQNLVSDFQLGVLKKRPSVLDRSAENVENLRRYRDMFYPSYEILHVGESLGGFHATYHGAKSGEIGIGIDAPGIGEFLTKKEKANCQHNVINFIAGDDNLVNTTNEQVGKLYRFILDDCGILDMDRRGFISTHAGNIPLQAINQDTKDFRELVKVETPTRNRNVEFAIARERFRKDSVEHARVEMNEQIMSLFFNTAKSDESKTAPKIEDYIYAAKSGDGYRSPFEKNIEIKTSVKNQKDSAVIRKDKYKVTQAGPSGIHRNKETNVINGGILDTTANIQPSPKPVADQNNINKPVIQPGHHQNDTFTSTPVITALNPIGNIDINGILPAKERVKLSADIEGLHATRNTDNYKVQVTVPFVDALRFFHSGIKWMRRTEEQKSFYNVRTSFDSYLHSCEKGKNNSQVKKTALENAIHSARDLAKVSKNNEALFCLDAIERGLKTNDPNTRSFIYKPDGVDRNIEKLMETHDAILREPVVYGFGASPSGPLYPNVAVQQNNLPPQAAVHGSITQANVDIDSQSNETESPGPCGDVLLPGTENKPGNEKRTYEYQIDYAAIQREANFRNYCIFRAVEYAKALFGEDMLNKADKEIESNDFTRKLVDDYFYIKKNPNDWLAWADGADSLMKSLRSYGVSLDGTTERNVEWFLENARPLSEAAENFKCITDKLNEAYELNELPKFNDLQTAGAVTSLIAKFGPIIIQRLTMTEDDPNDGKIRNTGFVTYVAEKTGRVIAKNARLICGMPRDIYQVYVHWDIVQNAASYLMPSMSMGSSAVAAKATAAAATGAAVTTATGTTGTTAASGTAATQLAAYATLSNAAIVCAVVIVGYFGYSYATQDSNEEFQKRRADDDLHNAHTYANRKQFDEASKSLMGVFSKTKDPLYTEKAFLTALEKSIFSEELKAMAVKQATGMDKPLSRLYVIAYSVSNKQYAEAIRLGMDFNRLHQAFQNQSIAYNDPLLKSHESLKDSVNMYMDQAFFNSAINNDFSPDIANHAEMAFGYSNDVNSSSRLYLMTLHLNRQDSKSFFKYANPILEASVNQEDPRQVSYQQMARGLTKVYFVEAVKEKNYTEDLYNEALKHSTSPDIASAKDYILLYQHEMKRIYNFTKFSAFLFLEYANDMAISNKRMQRNFSNSITLLRNAMTVVEPLEPSVSTIDTTVTVAHVALSTHSVLAEHNMIVSSKRSERVKRCISTISFVYSASQSCYQMANALKSSSDQMLLVSASTNLMSTLGPSVYHAVSGFRVQQESHVSSSHYPAYLADKGKRFVHQHIQKLCSLPQHLLQFYSHQDLIQKGIYSIGAKLPVSVVSMAAQTLQSVSLSQNLTSGGLVLVVYGVCKVKNRHQDGEYIEFKIKKIINSALHFKHIGDTDSAYRCLQKALIIAQNEEQLQRVKSIACSYPICTEEKFSSLLSEIEHDSNVSESVDKQRRRVCNIL